MIFQCKDMYEAPNDLALSKTREVREARKLLFANTRNALTDVELRKLESPPTIEEIQNIIWLLPADKAPGPDGLTTKVYRACWDFIKEDLTNMILDFWRTGTLSEKN